MSITNENHREKNDWQPGEMAFGREAQEACHLADRPDLCVVRLEQEVAEVQLLVFLMGAGSPSEHTSEYPVQHRCRTSCPKSTNVAKDNTAKHPVIKSFVFLQWQRGTTRPQTNADANMRAASMPEKATGRVCMAERVPTIPCPCSHTKCVR